MRAVNKQYILVDYSWLMLERPNGVEVYNKEELKRSKGHIKVVNELSENNIVYLKKVITTFKFGSLVVMVKFSRIIGQLLAEQILIQDNKETDYDFTDLIKDDVNKKSRRLALVGSSCACVSNGVYLLEISNKLGDEVYLSNKYVTLTNIGVHFIANTSEYKGCVHTILKDDEPLVGGDIYSINLGIEENSNIDVERLHKISTGRAESNMYIDFSKSRLQYLGEDAFSDLQVMQVKAIIELGDKDVYFSNYIADCVDVGGHWRLFIRTSRLDVYSRLIEAVAYEIIRISIISPERALNIKKMIKNGTGNFRIVYTGEHKEKSKSTLERILDKAVLKN